MSEPVIVIGGGQAGLAVARSLARRGVEAQILDAAARTGDAWRSRYASLVLFTPSQYSSLPERPFPLPADTYPTKDQAADYLEDYARHFELSIERGTRVERLACDGQRFAIETNRGRRSAAAVVVATGALQLPVVPDFARALDASVVQLHSCEYRDPSDLPRGVVAVVGAGNSGAQIAEELVHTHTVHLCFEKLPKRLPQRCLGIDVFWWLQRAGVLDRRPAPGSDGRDAVGAIPLIGTRVPALLRSGALRRAARVVAASDRTLHCADGRSLAVDAVVWATGFRNDFGWIEIPRAIRGNAPVLERGTCPIPGLDFVGMPGSRSKGSAFLGFVGRDADLVAERMAGAALARRR
jgi:putative flavoprotein involved in K+ transport